MSGLALTGGIVVLFAAIAAWLWLCAGVMRTGWRGVAGKLAVQVSALLLVWGTLRGQPMNGLFMALTAPLSLVLEVARLKLFAGFASALFWQAAPYAAAVLLVCLAVPRLRVWAPGLALAAMLVAGVWQGEAISQRAMCDTAARHGVTAFPRNTLLWSLANAPTEFQFEIHARLDANGQHLGWSYREMDWYQVPDHAWDNVNSGPVFTCR